MRTLRNFSQSALARASGLSQGAISSYETGSRKTTTGFIELAQALQVNPLWLITGTGQMEATPDSETTYTSVAQLRDIQQQPISVTWPFKTIKPSQYWALPEAQRRIIEQTVDAMITALHNERDSI